MNSYELSRHWFNWCFENPEKVKPIHSAVYFFAMEHCNRLGNKSKFGFPSQMTMDAIGVRKIQTYSKAFNDLVEWRFFTLVERSKNQYSANIISISAVPKNGTARGKALDKANIQHGAKQGHGTGQSMGQSKDTIIKPLTNKPINQEPINILLEKETKKPLKKIKKENSLLLKTGEMISGNHSESLKPNSLLKWLKISFYIGVRNQWTARK